MVLLKPLALAFIAGCFWVTNPANAGNEERLIQLLETRECPFCLLNDVDLTHADLRNADLYGAHLQSANLNNARLDGADLRGSDLSFTSLQGASLRGTDLRNSRLIGTDLSRTDLTGALLEPNALDQSHWDGAKGITNGSRSHPGLHNAGVNAAQAGRWAKAEQLFNAAILASPNEPLSWVARGLSRGEQGKNDLASRDLAHAGKLFADQGDTIKADQLSKASQLVYTTDNQTGSSNGNGIGSLLLSGALSTAQAIVPIALKALMPIIP